MSDSNAKHCAKCDRLDTANHLVGCDMCETWVHFDCAGVTDSIADPDRTWKCDRCRSLEDDVVSHSRTSVSRSSMSKRSTRVELSLQMIEEQKALRMRRILEEQAAQAVARNKLAEEEERFLRQKYDLLMTEADDAEEGASRKSRLSSRTSREKVRSWLSRQEDSTAQQVTVVPPSSMKSTVVATEAVQQSTIPAPITSSPITSNVPAIVTSDPASTSTPNSVDGSRSVKRSLATMVPQIPIPVRSDGSFVSRTEITFDVPQRPLVSSSLLTRCNSTVGIDTSATMDGPRKVNSSAPPPNIEIHPMSSSHYPRVNKVPISGSRASGCGDYAVTFPSSSRPILQDSIVITSVPQVSSINYGCTPIVSYNSAFPTAVSGQSQPCATSIPAQNYSSSVAFQNVGTNPRTSLVTGGQGSSQNPVSSVPLVHSRPVLSSGCQSTWINNNLASTDVGGIQSGNVSHIPVPSQRERTFVNNGGAPVTSNGTVPPAYIVDPLQFEIPVTQSAAGLRDSRIPWFSQQPPSQPQHPPHQQPVDSARSGPSSGQLAARQVMPRLAAVL